MISDIDEYQTWPGWLVLASRSSIMLWFLWELRNTMKYEHSTRKLDFLLHFGASSLVWFIYLPVVAIVALQVNALWRYKLLLGMTHINRLHSMSVIFDVGSDLVDLLEARLKLRNAVLSFSMAYLVCFLALRVSGWVRATDCARNSFRASQNF